MQLFTVFSAVLALLSAPVLGAPPVQLKVVEKYAGATKPNSYIVTLKKGVAKEAHVGWLQSFHGSSSNITHSDWDSDFFHGFAGTFDSEALNALRANPDVESIAEDGVFHITATQTNAPWGLQRISQSARLANQNPNTLSFTYTFDPSAGQGVDIFIVDTGIFTGHSDFGGRARWGATFGGYPDADGNGHGTHVSGTAAGSTFGVAKLANLIAVKVLSDSGSGFVSDIISGLNFVGSQAAASGRPTIASMSLGGGASSALDQAVTSLTNQGIHVTVAAGNDNRDAASTSPARAPSAITVGASTIADARASFSNFGSVVDIFAPGQNVICAWIGSSTATNNISGTSMATPHIAGLVAYLIRLRGNVSPAAMAANIQAIATKNALSGIPSGTINALAFNA